MTFRKPIIGLKSGADLTDYKDQLAKERTSRTLILRRKTNRPTIAAMIGQQNNRVNLIDPSQFPFLDPPTAISILHSTDLSKISEFCQQVIGAGTTVPRSIIHLANSEQFISTLDDVLMNPYPESTKIDLLKLIIILFPHCNDTVEVFIDNGLILTVMDFFSTNSPNLIGVCVTLISVISEKCYARDSILCMGLHEYLVEIALSQVNEQLTIASCVALSQVFLNPEAIDSATISSCVPLLAPLLDSLQSIPAIDAILSCFASLTNKMPAIVFQMYQMGMFPKIVNCLHNEQLVGTCLSLIGNLSFGDTIHIRALLELNIFPILISLLHSDYIADVFWALSNLLEGLPSILVGYFDHNFIKSAIEIAQTSTFDVKKEASYLLASLIIYTDLSNLEIFIDQALIDIFIDMLSCGVGMIVLHSLDALLRMEQAISHGIISKDLSEIFQNDDLIESLDSLKQQPLLQIQEKASFLSQIIEGVGDSPLSM